MNQKQFDKNNETQKKIDAVLQWRDKLTRVRPKSLFSSPLEIIGKQNDRRSNKKTK